MRTIICILVLCGTLCGVPMLSTGARAASAVAKKPAVAAVDTTVAKAHPSKPAPKAMRTEAVRTLDAINIEGEIAVPQVLFITARDFRRFRDGLGSRYEVSAQDVARAVSLPTRLRIVALNELNKEEGK